MAISASLSLYAQKNYTFDMVSYTPSTSVDIDVHTIYGSTVVNLRQWDLGIVPEV